MNLSTIQASSSTFRCFPNLYFGNPFLLIFIQFFLQTFQIFIFSSSIVEVNRFFILVPPLLSFISHIFFFPTYHYYFLCYFSLSLFLFFLLYYSLFQARIHRPKMPSLNIGFPERTSQAVFIFIIYLSLLRLMNSVEEKGNGNNSITNISYKEG